MAKNKVERIPLPLPNNLINTPPTDAKTMYIATYTVMRYCKITALASPFSRFKDSIKNDWIDPTAPEITAVSYPKSNPPSVATSVSPITKELLVPLEFTSVIILVLKSRGEDKDYTQKSLMVNLKY